MLVVTNSGLTNSKAENGELIDDLSSLFFLQSLDLSGNELASIPAHTPHILVFDNQLSFLTKLDLSSNQISTIGDSAFYYMPNLEWVDLSNNPLVRLDSCLFCGPNFGNKPLFVNLTFSADHDPFVAPGAFLGTNREIRVVGL